MIDVRKDPCLIDTLTKTIDMHFPERVTEVEGLYNYTYIFVVDLWKRGSHADAYNEMLAWLREHSAEYSIRTPTLSTRFIAIKDPDLSFMFFLRFK